MNEIEEKLKDLAKKTMFIISDEEMPALVKEYHIFMSHVKALEKINTTDVEPLAFPYEIETTYLREDVVDHVVSQDDILKNASCVQEHQIKVPKVVG